MAAAADLREAGPVSTDTGAHRGREPVYRSNRAELVALMGPAAYAVLADLCADFDQHGGRLLRHPADPTGPADVS